MRPVDTEVVLVDTSKKELMASFSQRLVEALKKRGFLSERAKLGVSVKELAQAMDCGRATILKYTTGDRLPSYDKALLIASFLEVDVAWLLYGDGVHSPEPEQHNSQVNQEDKECDYGLINQVLEKATPILSCGSAKDVIGFLASFFQNASKEHLSQKQVLNMLDVAVTSAASFSSLATSKKDSDDSEPLLSNG